MVSVYSAAKAVLTDNTLPANRHNNTLYFISFFIVLPPDYANSTVSFHAPCLVRKRKKRQHTAMLPYHVFYIRAYVSRCHLLFRKHYILTFIPPPP